jgi:hypothetical protein
MNQDEYIRSRLMIIAAVLKDFQNSSPEDQAVFLKYLIPMMATVPQPKRRILQAIFKAVANAISEED